MDAHQTPSFVKNISILLATVTIRMTSSAAWKILDELCSKMKSHVRLYCTVASTVGIRSYYNLKLCLSRLSPKGYFWSHMTAQAMHSVAFHIVLYLVSAVITNYS
jgi:hypothetical protein